MRRIEDINTEEKMFVRNVWRNRTAAKNKTNFKATGASEDCIQVLNLDRLLLMLHE